MEFHQIKSGLSTQLAEFQGNYADSFGVVFLFCFVWGFLFKSSVKNIKASKTGVVSESRMLIWAFIYCQVSKHGELREVPVWKMTANRQRFTIRLA